MKKIDTIRIAHYNIPVFIDRDYCEAIGCKGIIEFDPHRIVLAYEDADLLLHETIHGFLGLSGLASMFPKKLEEAVVCTVAALLPGTVAKNKTLQALLCLPPASKTSKTK